MQSLSPQERACPRWLPGVLIGLCAAQPLLDVLSFWTQDLAWGSKLTLSLRLLIFLGVMLTGFVLSDRRRFYWIAAAVCAALYAGHVLACLRANAPFTTANLISDATNFIRFAQLPLFTIAFITFLRCCRQGFASLERGITIAFWIIAAVALLSALTGTNPYTYPDKRIGLCGWFYFANSQSAILSMLVPLALCPALRSGQIRRWLPIAVVGFAELFCFATRLAYMSLFVTAIGMVITLALTKRGSAKVCAVLLLVVDGRQAYSLGATFSDLADIMLEYGAVNACNLDGGSSSMMWFEDGYVNRCASVIGIRPIPTGFLVK